MSRNLEEFSNDTEFTKQFGPDGCQVVLKNGEKCGEQQTLSICRELNQMYERKMREIDEIGGGDCVETKLRLQDLWIKDLITQNEELIQALERLEYECSQRVSMLEDKLTDSVKCGYQVMQKYTDLDLAFNIKENFQRVRYLENDLNNLIEFVKRFRDERSWNVDGLKFYEIDSAELIGDKNPFEDQTKLQDESKVQEYVKEIARKDEIIKDLRAEVCELKEKDVEEDFLALKKSMLDMRDALTAEVADKHDVICTLRRDIQLLEDQCRRADQQTHFKDDIIKELRKEIKHYKQKNKTIHSYPSPHRSSNHRNHQSFETGNRNRNYDWNDRLNRGDRNQAIIYVKEGEEVLKRKEDPIKPRKPRSKFTDTKKISMNYYEEKVYQNYQCTNDDSANRKNYYIPRKKYTSSYMDDLYLSLNARKALYNFDEEFKSKLDKRDSSKLNNSI